ncbi:hypothetical protein E2562_004436, partial [Oryza meyeriana var. granulata]
MHFVGEAKLVVPWELRDVIALVPMAVGDASTPWGTAAQPWRFSCRWARRQDISLGSRHEAHDFLNQLSTHSEATL